MRIMDIKRPTRFSYDNCIVRDRSDSESEVSFSLGLNDYNASAPQTSYHSSSDESEDSRAPPLKFGPYDCYVLMVGVLRRIEVYLNNSTDQDEQKHKLLEYSELTKQALKENYEYFVSSGKTNQLTVPSLSHNETTDNDVIDNIEKTAVTTRLSSFKSTSTPLPKSKIGKTRFSKRIQNLASLKNDIETPVTSVSHNGTIANGHNDIEETARRSSSKRAKKTPVPKAKVETNISSRQQPTLNDGTTNNNEHIKDTSTRKRSASSLNLQPVPVKRAKYVMQDARMARIQAKLHESINSFQKTSGSSESASTEEAPRKATKARTNNKNLDMVKSGAKSSHVQLNGEGTSRTRKKSLPNGFNPEHSKSLQRGKTTKSKDLGAVNTEKNQRQLSGEGTSGTRNKGLSKSLNIPDKNSCKKERRLKTKSGTFNSIQVVPNDEVNQNQSGDTKGTLNTSRVSMKRKLYSAESWLLTLSETLP